MFDADLDTLDGRCTLDAVAEAAAVARAAEARILMLACHWADLHAVVVDESSLPGTERLVRLGGAGTPEVAEFAPAELGAMLGMSTAAAAGLVGDALDLRHRHPRLWTRVRAGEVKGWVARTTRPLPADLAGRIDQTVARYADRKSAGELEAICVAEAIRLDPDGAAALAASARRTHGVWVAPSVEHGTKQMLIRADAADVIRLDAAIDHTTPYDAPPPRGSGPPGQTALGNLAPLTRHHHRIKTHTSWQVRQPFPGIHLWRSPHGRHFLVDHTGTQPLPA